ncbi:MAG: transglycosylase SLT domain-containing protein [Bacteroidales bacterium]|nr:transglycosylase SLT domain-containing protein [Bacteroidales bacterium]
MKYNLMAILMVLGMLVPCLILDNSSDHGVKAFDDGALRCVIAVKDRPGRYNSGLSIALLQDFAASRNMEIQLYPAYPSGNWTDSLFEGSVDILVMPKKTGFSDKWRRSPVIGDAVWLVSNRNVLGMREIERWIGKSTETGDYEAQIRRFTSNYNPKPHYDNKDTVDCLSPYDELFKKCCEPYGEDWRMMCAIAWAESKFCANCESEAGGVGTMQLLRKTLRKYGIENVYDQEANIRIATDYFEHLKARYRKAGLRNEDLLFHALTAYNRGEASVEIGNVPRDSGYARFVYNTYRKMCAIHPVEVLIGPDSPGGIYPAYKSYGQKKH